MFEGIKMEQEYMCIDNVIIHLPNQEKHDVKGKNRTMKELAYNFETNTFAEERIFEENFVVKTIDNYFINNEVKYNEK
jgi:hypothetical protein